MTRAWWLIAAGALACGDNARPDPVVTATSGTRLAVQWYGYPDGTRQPEPDEFYDTALHTRCAPRPWLDGVTRCVPVADDAVYVDDACATLRGLAAPLDEPTHFVAYEWRDGRRWPARAFTAGAEADPIARYFQRIDDACVGPFGAPPDRTAYELGDELAGAALVPIRDGELGPGRLGLRVRASDDGMQVPRGVRDRGLDLDCAPTVGAAGVVTCAPIAAAPATHFRDPGCAEPVVLVEDGAPVPTVAQVSQPSGCAGYRAVGPELATALYVQDGEACRPASSGARVFAVAAPLELAVLGRTVEATAGHRLQQIVLDDGALRWFDDALVDTAIRADCRRLTLAEVPRCVPAALAPALRLFTAGCVGAVDVAELPARSCARPAFALATADGGPTVHAIGAPVVDPLFRWIAGQCQAYVPAPGATVHALGPPLDPTAFAGAIYFGAR